MAGGESGEICHRKADAAQVFPFVSTGNGSRITGCRKGSLAKADPTVAGKTVVFCHVNHVRGDYLWKPIHCADQVRARRPLRQDPGKPGTVRAQAEVHQLDAVLFDAPLQRIPDGLRTGMETILENLGDIEMHVRSVAQDGSGYRRAMPQLIQVFAGTILVTPDERAGCDG